MKTLAGIAILIGCGFAAARAAGPALRVEGAAGRDGVVKPPLVLSLADVASMPRVTQRAMGHDNKEHVYEGVLLGEVLRHAGQPFGEDLRGPQLAKYVLMTAQDGYRAVFALPEFDPAFTPARILLADRADGKPLPEGEGPLRIVVPGEKRQARWIRMVEKIEILSSPAPRPSP